MLLKIIESKINRTRAKFNEFLSLRLERNSPVLPVKIKLVAIAKDEAAYLPEWIFHHIYFGFDSINVYVNNTTDNTSDLQFSLRSLDNLNWFCGDAFFKKSSKSAQVEIYKHELKLSRRQKFTHVMFLDIDEFWTPKNLNTQIKEFIGGSFDTDVLCFEWFNRTNEETPFSPAIQKRLTGYCGHHVKSLISTKKFYEQINPHIAFSENARYMLANGTRYIFNSEQAGLVSKEQQDAPLKSAFIVHRMLRSEEEYLAILSRGRPYTRPEKSSIFKNNRDGYLTCKGDVSIEFPKEQLVKYVHERDAFFEFYNLQNVMLTAHESIKARRLEIVRLIGKAPLSEAETLKKILNKVKLPDVLDAYKEFKLLHKID
tara:strand:- start:684 stop:1796 length:1113 start_codon:yes stop_codon:yes gene_type:complete